MRKTKQQIAFDNLPEKIVFIDNFTAKEFCGICGISMRNLTRLIKKGVVNPRRIKSKQGTLEYRFSDTDVKAFKWDNLPPSVKWEFTTFC